MDNEGMWDVQWNKIQARKMPVILRNLAPSNPFNPLNLWPEEIVDEKVDTSKDQKGKKDKGKKGGKQKKPKKADLIRAKLAKDLEDKKAKKDEEKLSNVKTVSLMNMKMSTTAGRLKQLYEILRDFHKKKNPLDAVDTWWEIDGMNIEDTDEIKEIHKKYKKYGKKTKEFLEGKDIVAFQLNEMADRLPPLNLHHMNTFVLDKWQREVLALIDQKQSTIVCAPTSSGKTVLSSYCCVIGGRVLFIVPTEPLAWQVAGLFHALLKGNVALVTDGTTYIPESYRVVVGTPYALEIELCETIGFDFHYAVYDEVHDLNGPEGDSLERIVKAVQCPFLALSATIGNSEALCRWWNTHHNSSVRLMEYRGRFINLQRMIWQKDTKKLQLLHPCSAVTLEYLQKEGFSKGDLAFTPRDTYALWQAFLKFYPKNKIEDISPSLYFSKNSEATRISLMESKQYEDVVKQRLQDLSTELPAETIELLKSFAPTLTEGLEEKLKDMSTDDIPNGSSPSTIPPPIVNNDTEIPIWEIVRELCKSSLIPSICFQLDETRCRQLFDQLLKSIEEEESLKYPLYRKKLEKELEEYEKLQKKKDALKSKKREEDERDAQEFDEAPPPDVHAPHPDYNIAPVGYRLSAAEFREIQYQLRRELSEESDDGHPLVRSLRRGIGIYLRGLPAAYLRIVQSLAQGGRLAIVFSDESLAYGVNMPFRTCCFCGDSGPDILTSLMAQQMAGRAGRRGLDRQGNILFAGMSWDRIQQLMRGLLPDVQGRPNAVYPTIALQSCLPHVTPDIMKRITSNPLIDFMTDSKTTLSFEKSLEWMEHLGVFESSKTPVAPYHPSKLAVDRGLVRLVFRFRDNPSEAMGIFSLLNILYLLFENKPGDNIGHQLAFFNVILRVIDRTKYDPTSAHADPLCVLTGQEDAWEKVTGILKQHQLNLKKLEEGEDTLQFAVPNLDDLLDGYVWSTLVDNRIPSGLSTCQLNLIKRRLWHVGDRLRVMHNLLMKSGKFGVLEEIVRKCFRRIKWILMDSEV